MRLKPLLAAVVLLVASVVTSAQGLVGTWKLVKESDGSEPKSGAIINLTLAADGTLALKAVQPGEVFEDQGSWSSAGDRITMNFEGLEKRVTSQKYVLSGTTLTLPVKILNEAPGTSTWTSASLAAPPASGSLNEILNRTLQESQQQDNETERGNVDHLAQLGAADVKGGLAESYYVQASIFFMKSYYYEAWYGWAKACQLQPFNGVYLNNLAMVLMELDKYSDALAILQQVTGWFPQLDPPWGNLATAYWKTGDLAKAETAVKKAMALSPNTGLYQYLYGKILKAKGRGQEAKKYFELAWELGYAGSGREGEPGGSESGGTGAPGSSGSGTGSPGSSGSGTGSPGSSGSPGGRPSGSRPPTPTSPGSSKPPGQFPPEWVGHYEAKYVRARSGENAKEATTMFGQGLTGTNINLQTLACAKEFSMDISNTGNISGHGKIMYVYQGKAVNPMIGLVPTYATVGQGGFAVNLKDGYQIRDWTFSGRVDNQGNVEIRGIPEQKLDCINVGKVEKISTWSPLPPDAPGPAMRGPFHMTLATGKDSGPHIWVDQWLELGDKLIRRVHYQAFIVKSTEPITPDCKYVKPKEAKCPASEYIKTKVSMSPTEGVTVEASKTYSPGQEATSETTTKVGTDNINVDTSGKMTVEGSKGMFTGSAEFNPTDGSYSVSVGVGVDTSQVTKGKAASIQQKIELTYDSKCGWGIKGTMGGKAGKFGAQVEGAVYFNKGA